MSINKIGFFWSGNGMTWLRSQTLHTFTRLNPEWEVTLYVDPFPWGGEVWNSQNIVQDFMLQHENTGVIPDGVKIVEWQPKAKTILPMEKITPSQRSNLFKWELLSNGGFYSDMDVVFVKPLNSMLNYLDGYDTGMSENENTFSIGFMFSKGKNRFFADILDAAINRQSISDYQAFGVKSVWSVVHDLNPADGTYHEHRIFRIPWDWFYFLDYTKIDKIFNDNVPVPDVAYGIHWYAGSPISQEYNKKMVDAKEFDNTISAAIRMAYDYQR